MFYNFQQIVTPYFEYTILNNTVLDIFISLLLLFGVVFGLRIFRKIVLARLLKWSKGTETNLDDKIIYMIQGVSPFFYWIVALYVSVQPLNTGPLVLQIVQGLFTVIIVYEIIKITQKVLEVILQKVTHQTQSTAMAGIRLIIRIVLWSVGLLLVLSNLGIDISALVASMGIGGIAVALAAQNILGDLFSSFSIYFDKPFEIGDFIMVGTDSGTVKKIGLKTTRIQTMQGEELVISNKELTTVRVQNFKKLERRRNTFSFGVTYDTSPEKLKEIPKIVKEILNKEEQVEADRVVFIDFGDFSLNFQAVYYLDSPDYAEYAETQHRINIAVLERFNEREIEMAFPTQTLYIQK